MFVKRVLQLQAYRQTVGETKIETLQGLVSNFGFWPLSPADRERSGET